MQNLERNTKKPISDPKEKIIQNRKKQILDRLKTDENIRTIKVSKKPLKKIGFLIIILALIGLLATNYSPWYYYKMNIQNKENGRVYEYEEFLYSYDTINDWDNPESAFLIIPVVAYFNGVFISYLYVTPTDANIGFIIILALGLSIIIFEWLDKKKGFSFEFFTSVQAVLYSIMLIPTIYIGTSVSRFVASYLLQLHHFGPKPEEIFLPDFLYKAKIEFLLSPASIIIFLIILFLFLIIFTVIETDLRCILKEVDKRNQDRKKPIKNKFGVKI